MNNKFFDKAKKRASQVLKDKGKMNSILRQVGDKIMNSDISLKGMKEKILVLSRMSRAYVKGAYRVAPWKSIIVITAVLIYFLMPIDLIPDFIPVTGLADDFSLILWVFNHLQDDINTFQVWEQQQSSS